MLPSRVQCVLVRAADQQQKEHVLIEIDARCRPIMRTGREFDVVAPHRLCCSKVANFRGERAANCDQRRLNRRKRDQRCRCCRRKRIEFDHSFRDDTECALTADE